MAMYFINSQQADGSLAGWMDGYIQILERVSEEMPFGTGHGLERRMRKSSCRGIALFARNIQKINKTLYHTDSEKDFSHPPARISLSRVKRFRQLIYTRRIFIYFLPRG
jgi:hypothetical protein